MFKTVKFVRFFSIILFLVVLGLTYAYLPIMVQLTLEEPIYEINKSNFFYYATGIFLVINIFLWLLIRMASPMLMRTRGEEVTAWFSSISSILNFYLMILIAFIGVFNNPGQSYAQSFAYLNYIGPGLIFIWIVGLIYLLNRKIDQA